MTINQLFNQMPSKDLIENIIKSFGLQGFNDNNYFSKIDTSQEQINLIIDKINELTIYYLPCKRKIYFDELNYKKCITIMRQCLKLFNYKIKSKEKYFKGQKKIIYQIIPNDKTVIHKKINDECIINFD